MDRRRRPRREPRRTVVGGGLAGSEAAWALAERGIAGHAVRNAPGGADARPPDRPSGRTGLQQLLQVDRTRPTPTACSRPSCARSAVCCSSCADVARVPAGAALAVDRDVFSPTVHQRVAGHPNITLVRGGGGGHALAGRRRHRATHLRSRSAAGALRERLGSVRAGVLRRDRADRVRGVAGSRRRSTPLSRYGKGDGDDYLNAPLDPRGIRRRSSTR